MEFWIMLTAVSPVQLRPGSSHAPSPLSRQFSVCILYQMKAKLSESYLKEFKVENILLRLEVK